MNDNMDRKYLISIRRKTLTKVIIFIILIVALLVGKIILGNRIDIANIPIGMIIFLLGTIGLLFLIVTSIIKYNKEFKSIVFPILMKEMLNDVKYLPKDGITKETLEGLEMIEHGDEIISSECLTGLYKNTLVGMSNLKLVENKEVYDSATNSHKVSHTIFDGKWYIIALKYGFVDDVLIADKYSNLPRLGYDSVVTDYDKFDRKFKVLSSTSSQFQTFFNDDRKRMVLEFANNIKDDIILYFHGDKLHIGINSGKDKIKVPLFDKFDVDKYKEQFFLQFAQVIKFVEDIGFFLE